MDLNGLVDKVKELQAKNEEQQKRQQRMEKEFNEQRAAMRDLYVKKEAELRRLADELEDVKTAARLKEEEVELVQRNYKEEVDSLHCIMRESVKEAVSDSRDKMTQESQAWRHERADLTRQIEELQTELAQHRPDSSFLHLISKGLKKVTSAEREASAETSNQELEEAMRRAQKDADVLKSIVGPYQEEIASLKAKVREAYEQLDLYERRLREERSVEARRARQRLLLLRARRPRRSASQESPRAGHKPPRRSASLSTLSSAGDGDGDPASAAEAVLRSEGCELCASYEQQLAAQRQQLRERSAQSAVLSAKHEAEVARIAELTESLQRLEAQCREASAAGQERAAQLASQLASSRDRLDGLAGTAAAVRSEVNQQVAALMRDRDCLQGELDQLKAWYDKLLVSRSAPAEQMRQELLGDIPREVDELQVLVLRFGEELINERVNREHLDQRYQSEAAFAKQKLLSESEQLKQTEELLQAETCRSDQLQSDLQRERDALKQTKQQLASLQEKSREVANNLMASEADLKAKVSRLETENGELRNRVACLQSELQNSESVQKDFVKLSQSLQVQLESLRQQESEVRWQFVEDAHSCQSCGLQLSLPVKPRRCLHCVKIFCHDCTAKTVASGPSQRSAHVCNFCHTLVVKDAVPYFSVKAPAQR